MPTDDEKEAIKRLMDLSDEDLKSIPTPEMPDADGPKITFEDEDKEGFDRIAASAFEGESGEGGTGMDETNRLLGQILVLLRDLPHDIAETLGAGV